MVKATLRTEDGVTIEVEATANEYLNALEMTLRAIRQVSNDEASPPNQGPVVSRGQLAEFIDRLSPETLEYLGLLVSHPDGLSDDAIARKLGIGDNRQKLAGMNGAITKVAANVGIPEDVDIIRRQVSRDADGSRTYHYEVPRWVRSILEDLLPARVLDDSQWAAAPPPSEDDVPF